MIVIYPPPKNVTHSTAFTSTCALLRNPLCQRYNTKKRTSLYSPNSSLSMHVGAGRVRHTATTWRGRPAVSAEISLRYVPVMYSENNLNATTHNFCTIFSYIPRPTAHKTLPQNITNRTTITRARSSRGTPLNCRRH